MAARVFVALCLIAAVLIGASRPASACTCANRPAEELLAAADGAFIGTLVGIPASAVGPLEGGRPSVIPQSLPFVFDAERWVKVVRRREHSGVVVDSTTLEAELDLGKTVRSTAAR